MLSVHDPYLRINSRIFCTLWGLFALKLSASDSCAIVKLVHVEVKLGGVLFSSCCLCHLEMSIFESRDFFSLIICQNESKMSVGLSAYNCTNNVYELYYSPSPC